MKRLKRQQLSEFICFIYSRIKRNIVAVQYKNTDLINDVLILLVNIQSTLKNFLQIIPDVDLKEKYARISPTCFYYPTDILARPPSDRSI